MADSGCRTEHPVMMQKSVEREKGTLAGAMLYGVIIAVAPPTAGSPIRMRHPAAAYYGSPSRTTAQSAGAYGNSFV